VKICKLQILCFYNFGPCFIKYLKFKLFQYIEREEGEGKEKRGRESERVGWVRWMRGYMEKDTDKQIFI
jgi:hypothetical protein